MPIIDVTGKTPRPDTDMKATTIENKLRALLAGDDLSSLERAIKDAITEGKSLARLGDGHWEAVSPCDVWDGMSIQHDWACAYWEVVATHEELTAAPEPRTEWALGRVTCLPFPSLLGAAEWAGYEENRLVSLSPSLSLREREAARHLTAIGARWEDTQYGPVVQFP